MSNNKSTFQILNSVNVSPYVEKKGTLSYLTWSKAWEEFSNFYPEAEYGIKKTKDKNKRLQPYFESELGIMVETWVKKDKDSVAKPMWLPVMDNKNNAMKFVEYDLMTPWGKKVRVQPATMFDINTALMRCLTKNLAMFGLGLHIYTGEDIPKNYDSLSSNEINETKEQPKKRKVLTSGTENFDKAIRAVKEKKYTAEEILANYEISKADAKLLIKASNE